MCCFEPILPFFLDEVKENLCCVVENHTMFAYFNHVGPQIIFSCFFIGMAMKTLVNLNKTSNVIDFFC
jgi:hypothetical protein